MAWQSAYRPEPRGDGGVLESILTRLLPLLMRWTHRRLPRYARRRMDSGDLVQEAILGVLTHRAEIDLESPAALQRYLQQSIRNRIRDEIRRAKIGETENSVGPLPADSYPSPLEAAMSSEDRVRYRAALLRLDADDQQLVVGRVELGLSYEDLALATRRPSADAARVAARRAVLRLAKMM